MVWPGIQTDQLVQNPKGREHERIIKCLGGAPHAAEPKWPDNARVSGQVRIIVPNEPSVPNREVSENRGYGANQKTCYRLALAAGADIIIMIHPDYQYTPQLIPAMAALVASGLYPCALASRILGGGALRGGMPWWKYVSNRFLTLAENFLLGAKLSEYHTGYRAFSRQLLERLPLEANSDDFVFDNQILAQIIALGCAIGEVTCPARYMPEASSINFRRSVRYGLGCMATALRFRLARWGLAKPIV